MAYAQIEFDFWSNPKVLAAGKYAALLYIASCGHCSQHLTDGFIAESAIPFIANMAWQRSYKKQVSALVENGLWLKVEGGYKINDYLKHNKSKAEVAEYREKKSKAGKASAEARARTRVQTDVQTGDKQMRERLIEQVMNYDDDDIDINTTTDPPFNPPTRSEDQEKTVKMLFDVFQEIMGFMPVIDPLLSQRIQDMVDDNVTEPEYRAALLQMRASEYECKTPASAHTWILNNRKPKKKRNGNGAGRDFPHPIPGRKIPGYVPDTSNTEVLRD
jgi:hypothetical protein